MSQKEDPNPQNSSFNFQSFPYSPQYCPPMSFNSNRNQNKFRKYSNLGHRTQPIKKQNRRRRFAKSEEQPLSPMNTTQFILNSQGFYENQALEGFEVNNFNFENNYGSMLGVIDEEFLSKDPEERNKKDEGSEIDLILKLSRKESDPLVLMDSIEKLAKIIKEKQEKIQELEKSVKGGKEEEKS